MFLAEASLSAASHSQVTTDFIFCQRNEAKGVSEDGGAQLLSRVERGAQDTRAKKKEREFLTPTTKLQNGELYAYLLKRSSKNDREWQRRWCVLRRDGLYHCRSKEDQTDIQCIALTHNTIRMTANPQLSNCFEIHTSQSVEHFRAKTLYECKEWITSVQRNIKLASENEYFMLAEYMVADEERAASMRLKKQVEAATGSLEGILAIPGGLRTLIRFAKVEGRLVDMKLLLLYVDAQRARNQFLLVTDNNTDNSHLQNTRSPKSTTSLSSIGSARLSEPPPSPLEWTKNIIDKHNNLLPKRKLEQAAESSELCKLLTLVEENLLEAVRASLYKHLCASEDFVHIIASLPVTV